MSKLPPLPLPSGITARYVPTDSGLDQHVLEAGDPGQPLLLLLHGFPELAFSWRHVMVPLAKAGFHVVAPDQRGYGRTTGWEPGFDCDLYSYSLPNRVRDAVALVRALGYERVYACIGHDYGAHVTAIAGLLRPDVFQRIACMSAPFGGAPAISSKFDPVHEDLLALSPPRKHYQWYYSTRSADRDMQDAPQGLQAFLRAYFHMKSADWAENRPHVLQGWTASELAKLPTYYVMHADETMAGTVAPHMPSNEAINACRWMSEADMAVYAAEYGRTGFQAALNSYRCATASEHRRDMSVFHGVRISVPTVFLAGQQDWGWAQVPGALERMESTVCSDYRGTHLIDGAGHWVQQEQPEAVVAHLLDFLS